MEILTTKSLYEMDTDELSALWNEQNCVLEKMGYDLHSEYIIKFGQQKHAHLLTIDEAIQCLALKDGCDLVKFENGNIGFVGYYNGFSLDENHFEILRLPTHEDIAKCSSI